MLNAGGWQLYNLMDVDGKGSAGAAAALVVGGRGLISYARSSTNY